MMKSFINRLRFMRMPMWKSNFIIFWPGTSSSMVKWKKNQRSKQRKLFSNYSKNGDMEIKFGVSSWPGTGNDEELH